MSCGWPTCSTPLFSRLYRTDLLDSPSDTMRSFVPELVPFLYGHLNTSFTFVPTISNHTTHKIQMQAKFSTLFKIKFRPVCRPLIRTRPLLTECQHEPAREPLDNRFQEPVSLRCRSTGCTDSSHAMNRKAQRSPHSASSRGAGNDMRVWLQYNPCCENLCWRRRRLVMVSASPSAGGHARLF